MPEVNGSQTAGGGMSERKLLTQTSIKRAIEANITEAAVSAAITGYLRAQRIPYTITEAMRSYNQKQQLVQRVRPGWPDITGCFEGIFPGIECKRPIKGRLSYLQAVELEALYRQGALVVVARSLDDVIQLIETRAVSQATKDEIAAALTKGPETKRRTK
jgi:hypothetical protein